MDGARYDAIGATYATTRREDPQIAAVIHAALCRARTVVNVGAGAGSYEPRDRHVIAVEPSEVMIAQRDPGLPPAIPGGAYPLPLEDRSVDAAMAVFTIHHWDEDQVREVPISPDSPDWSLGSFWAHPERVLDTRARSSTSGFARMPPEVVDRVVAAVERDLRDGTWDARHGRLRKFAEYDAGLRLVVSNPA